MQALAACVGLGHTLQAQVGCHCGVLRCALLPSALNLEGSGTLAAIYPAH